MKFEEIDSQQNLAYLLRTFNGMPLKRLLETREEMRKALRITEELGAFISGKHDGKPDEDFYHDLREHTVKWSFSSVNWRETGQ